MRLTSRLVVVLSFILSFALAGCSGGGGGGGSGGGGAASPLAISVTGLQGTGAVLNVQVQCMPTANWSTILTTSASSDGAITMPAGMSTTEYCAAKVICPDGFDCNVAGVPTADYSTGTNPCGTSGNCKYLPPYSNSGRLASINLGMNQNDPGYANPFNVVLTVSGTAVPSALRGQWSYVDTGATILLAGATSLNYTQVDNNLLKVTGPGNLSDIDQTLGLCVAGPAWSCTTYTYYLARSGIPNVAATGTLSTSSSNGGTALSMRSLTSVGGIDVIFKCAKDPASCPPPAKTDANGNWSAAIPSGPVEVVIPDPTDPTKTTSCPATVKDAAVDVGDCTLVPATLYSFKSEIVNSTYATGDSDWLYFGTLPGQDAITYSKTISVKNIGKTDASGVSFVVSTTDPDVSSLVVTNTLGGMAAGASLGIPVTFSFKRPATDKDVAFTVDITDIAGRKWKNRVTLKLSSHTPVQLYVTAKTVNGWGAVNGFVATPGRTLQKLTGNYSAPFLRLPYIAGDIYELMISNPTITAESAYSIGFGVAANTDFSTFINTAIHEPNDSLAQATTLTVGQGDMAYVSVGDIDYYKLVFDSTNAPADPNLVGTVDLTATPYGVATNGTYTYVVDNANLKVVDVTAPGTPVVAGSVAISGAMGVAVSGSYVYVVGGNFLRIVDVTTPTAPVVVGSVAITSATGVAVSGNYAYVADGSNLKIVDVTTPATPVVVGSVAIAGASRVGVNGSIAYVIGNQYFKTVDITTPASPAVLGTLAFTYSLRGAFATSGNYAYMTDGNNLFVVDATTAATPTLSKTMPASGASNDGISVSGTMLYLSNQSYSNTSFFDITAPATPVLRGSILNGFGYKNIGSGNYAYVIAGTKLNVIKLQ